MSNQLAPNGVVQMRLEQTAPAAPPAAPPAPAPAIDVTQPPAVAEEEVEETIPASVDPTLVRILSWKRPHDSTGELNFCTWLRQELEKRGVKPSVGPSGNIIVVVPVKTSKKGKTTLSDVLFSCHTDTVHSDCNGDQGLIYDPSFGHIILDKKTNPGSCLGADDGAGIWLMLEMITAKVPGTYIFHRGEERGGIGSQAMLRERKPFLEQHKIAVAFDRKEVQDIVTHQGGVRCGSDKCGLEIARRLNEVGGFKYQLSTTGSFTDTKTYYRTIDECFNISCGYRYAHSSSEELDYGFLVRLRDAVVKIDWATLPIDRDASKVPEPAPYMGGYKGKGGYQGGYQGRFHGGMGGLGLDDDGTEFGHVFGNNYPAPSAAPAPLSPPLPKAAPERKPAQMQMRIEPRILDELRTMDADELRDVAGDPDAAFDTIINLYAELEGAMAKIEMLRSLITP